jgi:hypothetical protein
MPLIVSEWERLPRPTRLDNRSRVAYLFNGTPDILSIKNPLSRRRQAAKNSLDGQ